MSALIFVAFVILLLPVVLIIVILTRIGGIDTRLERLESLLQRLPAPSSPAAKPSPVTAPPAFPAVPAPAKPHPPPVPATKPEPPPVPPAPVPTPSRPPPVPPAPIPAFHHPLREIHLGQTGLLIAGLLLTLLGIGFFLKYSFEQGWINPTARVFLTYGAGIALALAGAVFRRRGHHGFGLGLIGGGLGAFYFAGFAAHGIFALIGQATAFGLLIATTLLAGTLAVALASKWLAVLGLIGGFLSPVVLGPGAEHPLVLPFYLGLLNAGILAVTVFRRWSLLLYLGCGFTWALFLAWQIQRYQPEHYFAVIAVIQLYLLTYSFGPFAYALFRKPDGRMGPFLVTAPNAIAALGFCLYLTADRFTLETGALFSLGYAALALWATLWLMRRRPQEQMPAAIMLAQGLAFVGVTVPVLFDGGWIAAFWALLAAGLIGPGLRSSSRTLKLAAAIFLVLGVGMLFYGSYEPLLDRILDGRPLPDSALDWSRVPQAALVLAALGWTGLALARNPAPPDSVATRNLATIVAWSAFGALLFLVANVEVFARVDAAWPAARGAALSILWAAYSFGLIALGFRLRLPALRWIALGLFAVTIAKVLLFDMAQAATPYRIASSVFLGLLLVGASYLYYAWSSRIRPSDAPKAGPGAPEKPDINPG
ncbi:MAG: DUF2339 domain-containing protein [Puniceicoccaceae bacterium]|nr:MAG: DUF2339 domain-containing protein [Puniceicoccaceae bacterium]